jgi:uncharacterized protein YndB with AHSA1/START domain
MSSTKTSPARAVADVAAGAIVASVEIAAPPERVFRAMTTAEVASWWVRPGVFTTDEWSGDVRVGGRWRSSGVARGERYQLEGEFLEVDPPRKLTFTWQRAGMAPTTVTYLLEPHAGGTRVTLRHDGFTVPEACEQVTMGWQTAFETLVAVLATR